MKSPDGGFLKGLRKKMNRELVSWLSKNALQDNNNVVLEAGSGTAEGASLLADRMDVRLSVAIDLNMAYLRQARDRDGKVSLVRGDLFRLPFKPESFDLVWSNSTIEHVSDTRRVIYEMVHVTKKGGRVFLGVPNARGPLRFLFWFPAGKLVRKTGQLFDESALAIDIEGIGLALEKFTTYFYNAFLGCLARKE